MKTEDIQIKHELPRKKKHYGIRRKYGDANQVIEI